MRLLLPVLVLLCVCVNVQSFKKHKKKWWRLPVNVKTDNQFQHQIFKTLWQRCQGDLNTLDKKTYLMCKSIFKEANKPIRKYKKQKCAPPKIETKADLINLVGDQANTPEFISLIGEVCSSLSGLPDMGGPSVFGPRLPTFPDDGPDGGPDGGPGKGGPGKGGPGKGGPGNEGPGSKGPGPDGNGPGKGGKGGKGKGGKGKGPGNNGKKDDGSLIPYPGTDLSQGSDELGDGNGSFEGGPGGIGGIGGNSDEYDFNGGFGGVDPDGGFNFNGGFGGGDIGPGPGGWGNEDSEMPGGDYDEWANPGINGVPQVRRMMPELPLPAGEYSDDHGAGHDDMDVGMDDDNFYVPQMRRMGPPMGAPFPGADSPDSDANDEMNDNGMDSDFGAAMARRMMPAARMPSNEGKSDDGLGSPDKSGEEDYPNPNPNPAGFPMMRRMMPAGM